MDLRELRLSLRRHWVISLLAFDLCVIAGVLAAYLPARVYTAEATLITEVLEVDGSTPESVARAIAFELPTLVERVESRSASAEAGAVLPEVYANLSTDVEASFVTSVFKLKVDSPDPEASAEWAEALAQWLIAEKGDTSFYRLVLVDTPEVPEAPSFPKPVPLIAGATALGAIVALFAAVAAARFRDAFDSSETIRQRLGATVLAEIPTLRGLRKPGASTAQLLEHGQPGLVEAFQGLRTNVEFQIARGDVKTIAVASFRAGEGKSTVASGLGWSLAALGHSVAMIDADLRRPSLHRQLGEQIGSGLADVADRDVLSLVKDTSIRNLKFLPAGLPIGRPGDLVPVNLPKAVNALRDRFEIIVIDAPPIRDVVETALIVKEARHVILVIDAASTELPEISVAVDRLRESGAVLLGVVINRVRRRIFDRKSPYYTATTLGANPQVLPASDPNS